MTRQQRDIAWQALLEALECYKGNQSALARDLSGEVGKHIYPSRISNWVNRDRRVSPALTHPISRLTGVPVERLRPDIFV